MKNNFPSIYRNVIRLIVSPKYLSRLANIVRRTRPFPVEKFLQRCERES